MSNPRSSAHGVLEMHPKGYGFLRNPARHYAPTQQDAYVPAQLIGKFNLAEGVSLGGPLEPQRRGQGPRLATVEQIEGGDPKSYRRREWDELTAVDPTKWIRLETGPEPSGRPRRPVDAEARPQAPGAARRRDEAGRGRDPRAGLRLQEPPLHRPAARADPALRRDPRGSP